MPALKVYRTPIGFHDAYVAAPSQKAALAAWGSDANLFARGVAEQVTDPALTEAALAQPGVVIRKLRGTADEQFAALPPDAPRRPVAEPAEPASTKPKRRPKPAPKPKPPPSRAGLDRADKALADARERHEQEDAALAAREAALAREREKSAREHAAERKRLERALEQARADYDRALEKWSA